MQGLTALVTGGGSGIGLASARLLLDGGANVMIAGRDATKLRSAAESLGDANDRLKFTAGDVSSEGWAKKLVNDAVDAFGGLHILINSAGVLRSGRLFDMEEEDFDYVMDINLKGTWLMCKFAARAITQTKTSGAIVNVSSLLANRALPNFPASAYSASKGGIVSLTRALAVELAPSNIRVNAVLPALIKTPMLGEMVGVDNVDEMTEKAKKRYPLGRVGEPEDVAKAILYLANPENSWITGCEITVDGGISLV